MNTNLQKNIAFLGGGSGGHIFPIKNLIIYGQKNYKKTINNIYRFGQKSGFEYKVFSELKCEKLYFINIITGKIRREKNIMSIGKNIIDMSKIIIGICQSFLFFKKYKIDVVFCKGGYVALPVLIASKILGKKLIVHESDSKIGMTNRFAKSMKSIFFCGYDFVCKKNIGQILSDELVFLGDKSYFSYEIQKKLNSNKTKILVIGGSLGSSSIYDLLEMFLKKNLDLSLNYEFFIIGGYLNKNISDRFGQFDNVFTFDFLSQSELGELYFYCDLSITRGGSTSLFEQDLYKIKKIIVPIPRTHDQLNNARFFEKKGDIVLKQDKSIESNFLNIMKKIVTFKKGNVDLQYMKKTIELTKKTIWEVF